MDPFGRLRLSLNAGEGRSTTNPPTFIVPHKPGPPEQAEPPLRSVGTFGIEYLLGGAGAKLAAEGVGSLLSVGGTLFKIGVGSSINSALYGYVFSTAFKPLESVILTAKEGVLTQPPGPKHLHPILDPTAPFTEIYRLILTKLGAPNDPERLRVEQEIRNELQDELYDGIDRLRQYAGKLAQSPPTGEVVQELEKLSAALDRIGGVGSPPGRPTFAQIQAGVNAALERQRNLYLLVQEVGVPKGPGHGFIQFDKVEIDP